MINLANHLDDAGRHDSVHADTRSILDEAGFTGAADAPQAAIDRITSRVRALIPLISSLPDADAGAVVESVNAELAHLPIAPSITDHADSGLHIHWTRAVAAFDDQVIADLLMALATELCDHGTQRFGRCAATDCDDLFYDATRNRSRRFCADPRCASRTHTADHRARQRAG
jgi:predicted RNA-binding Zn ribbon-like protein